MTKSRLKPLYSKMTKGDLLELVKDIPDDTPVVGTYMAVDLCQCEECTLDPSPPLFVDAENLRKSQFSVIDGILHIYLM